MWSQFQEAEDNPPPALEDHGYFSSPDILAALSAGELDELRMTKLRDGFYALLRAQ